MRTIAKAASSSLVMGCMALALVVIAIAAIGIAGTRAASGLGNTIAGDELTTSTTTGQLARNMDAAYATGEAALTTAAPATRASQLGRLYTSLFPTIDAELFTLQRLHADDPAIEHNDIELFLQQWNKVRDLLSPPAMTGIQAEPGAGRPGDRRLPAGQQPPEPPVRQGSGRRQRRQGGCGRELAPDRRVHRGRRGARHRDRRRHPAVRDPPDPPQPGARPGPGRVR